MIGSARLLFLSIALVTACSTSEPASTNPPPGFLAGEYDAGIFPIYFGLTLERDGTFLWSSTGGCFRTAPTHIEGQWFSDGRSVWLKSDRELPTLAIEYDESGRVSGLMQPENVIGLWRRFQRRG